VISERDRICEGIGSGSKFSGFGSIMAITEAERAPAIEDFINQVIRNRILLGNQIMTIFTFPRATVAIFYLFEYHRYFPFNKTL
jgi:hypothetical protein